MRNLLTCLFAVAIFTLLNSCQKEISVEYGEPANGSLRSSAGDCLPKLVGGSYIANKALNDSNFIEVTVDVLSAGPYTITTDSLNGYSFKASGTFANTGANTVRLKSTGRPVVSGINNFTVFFDSSFCDIAVTVLPAGSSGGPAAFTLNGAPGGCTAFDLGSVTYYKDTTLDARHTVKVNVTVTTVGSYSISTNTVNGYSFSNSGTFGATGPAQVILTGNGKPLAAGTDNFTVTAGASTCSFPVTVTTATPPAGSCTVSSLQGTFTAGTATTATNRVVLTHTYATAGNVSVSTNTVNGYSFGPTNHLATVGSNSITLNATGTPLAAGTNTFTVTFGDGQTCTFTVTVTGTAPPVNNDYFPTTTNSYWTYNYGAGVADTFKMTSSGTTTVLGGNTYQRFTFSGPSGPSTYEEYYRKTAAAFYHQSVDTAYWRGTGLLFGQRYHDVLFLKNTLATGDSLTTDYNAQLDTSSTPTPAYVSIIWRYKFKVISSNATLTVNGKTFTNVYHLRGTYDIGFMGQFFDSQLDPTDYYYVRGVGRIQVDYGTTSEDIRYWQVN